MVAGGSAPTRRGLLVSAAGLGAGAALAGCGTAAGARPGDPADVVPAPARSAAAHDASVLVDALALERRTIAAYTAGIPLIASRLRPAATAMLSAELVHAGELIKLIHRCGVQEPGPPDGYDLGDPQHESAILALLTGLESEQAMAYLRWIPRLSSGPIRAVVAAILAADAQHLAVLRGARGLPPLTAPALRIAA